MLETQKSVVNKVKVEESSVTQMFVYAGHYSPEERRISAEVWAQGKSKILPLSPFECKLELNSYVGVLCPIVAIC